MDGRGGADESYFNHEYVLDNFDSSVADDSFVFRYSSGVTDFPPEGFTAIVPDYIEVNSGLFINLAEPEYPAVRAVLRENRMIFSCSCSAARSRLCSHESRVLYNIVRREEIRIFFDQSLRKRELKSFAADYGLENEPDPDNFFDISYNNKKIIIAPKIPELFPVTGESIGLLRETLFGSAGGNQNIKESRPADDTITCLVFRQHKFYRHLQVELYQAAKSKDGKFKNPFRLHDISASLSGAKDQEELRFYSAVNHFRSSTSAEDPEADIENLRIIAGNPLNLPVFIHRNDVSENVSTASAEPVDLNILREKLSLTVEKKDQFYEVKASQQLDGFDYFLGDLQFKFGYFIYHNRALYLLGDVGRFTITGFFKKKSGILLIHSSKFPEFRRMVLSDLEDRMKITYSWISKATSSQEAESGVIAREKIVYLTEHGNYVHFEPVMRYGEVEVPVLSDRLLYLTDSNGNDFYVGRNKEGEIAFISLITRQHPYFAEQFEEGLSYFYLPKGRLMEDNWFQDLFEEWQKAEITVYGFTDIEGISYNPYKARITVRVTSGINWFNTDIDVRFGKTRAGFRQVWKAVRNKSKFVMLDDGTRGILPAEWIEKFEKYFAAGEVIDDTLRTARINFRAIEELYDEEYLDSDVKMELAGYESKLNEFGVLEEVEVPAGFNGTLRHYQRQGLNWLNFLDGFGFGGCLADDMGLGKTVQIIAFILLQRRLKKNNTNLIVVPASLIFNWQDEVQKFAPSIKVLTLYGSDRTKNTRGFSGYEIILTSYGTLLSDVVFLKNYEFNYIFLDESQNIKNPDSQRYKAACLLKSRNRIVITGTPLENNTFDIYGQLSFACPGLLGSKRYFRDIYSIPIDKFKNRRRMAELQRKISPFILRRTKSAVAAELPEKTEMVIHCEMAPAQQAVYDAYEKELREFISATTEEEIPKKSMYVLKGLTRLRQICNSPRLLKDQSLYAESSAKIEVLMEQIESKSPQHKILVFSQFVSMLELIRKELQLRNIGYSYLVGATKDRGAEVKKFSGDDDLRVFLISLKAGGTGLNLTSADYVYLIDPWWNPAVENQAIDRCFRIGQKKNVVAVRLICRDTVEEKIIQLQESKKELTGNLIKSDTSLLHSFKKEDLMDLLGLNRHAGKL